MAVGRITKLGLIKPVADLPRWLIESKRLPNLGGEVIITHGG